MRVLGAVLAGGRSRRFGSDKALAIWRDQALIAHVIDALRPIVDTVLVCGRDWPGLPSVPDRPYADLGPLGGVNAALAYGSAHGFDRVLSAPCDAPIVPVSLLKRLIDQDGPAIVADMPVIGCWPSNLGADLDRHLERGGSRSIKAWADATGAAAIQLRESETLANINCPADLAALPDN